MPSTRIASAILVACLGLAGVEQAYARPGPPFIRTQPHPSDPSTLLRNLQRAVDLEGSASELALSRTTDPHIRALAKQLGGHARIVAAGLQSLAIQGAQLPSGTRLTRSEHQTLEQLRALKEPNFDARYLQAMRGLYEEMLQDLRAYQQNGRRGPVRNFAAQIMSRAHKNLRDIRRTQETM